MLCIRVVRYPNSTDHAIPMHKHLGDFDPTPSIGLPRLVSSFGATISCNRQYDIEVLQRRDTTESLEGHHWTYSGLLHDYTLYSPVIRMGLSST